MKKAISLIGVVALICACTTTPSSYTVSGTVDSTLNGQIVYMRDYEKEQNVDSTTVVDSKFTFSGQVDTAVIRRLDLSRTYANVILENGDITIDFENNYATGTPLNDTLVKYDTKMKQLYKESSDLYNAVKSDSTLDDQTRKAKFEQNKEAMAAKLAITIESVYNANLNNALGAYVLWSCGMPTDFFETQIQKAGDYIKNFAPIANEIKRIEVAKNTAPGRMFIDAELTTATGETVKLSDYVGKGKYTLIDFWASWCGPCRAEIPNLANIHDQYGQDVQVIGLNVWDQLEPAKKSIEELAMTWTILRDAAQSNATELYGINGIPQIMLIGPDGTIVARDLRNEMIENRIKEELAKK